MSLLHRLGGAILAVAAMGAAMAGSFAILPEPADAIVIDRAVLRLESGSVRDIRLPPGAAERRLATAERAAYLLRVDLASPTGEPLFLLVPPTGQDFALSLNGEPIYDSDLRRIWADPIMRGSLLVRLPRSLLRAGSNELAFTFEKSQRMFPARMGRVFVGRGSALAPAFKLRNLIETHLKVAALAAQALFAIGILIAYLYRPRDRLFGWLAAAALLTLIVSVGLIVELESDRSFIRAHIIALLPATGLAIVGVALGLLGRRPPGALAAAAAAIPVVLSSALAVGAISREAVASVSVAVNLAAVAVAAGVLAWGAFRRHSADAGLLLAPVFLLAWFQTRDAGMLFGFFDGEIVIAPYARPLVLAALLVILMRSLALSLDKLDRANEHLHARLEEREAELAALHLEERREAARLVREEERQRLTRDLHDGISGHLISIIAMAERSPADARFIEQLAREALDDLRLVINSLDLEDHELPLALATLRERLAPRLARIGVDLCWSNDGLAEVTGVTPGNALMILRIVQEAVTNAIKHGPAQRIVIRAGRAAVDGAVITIENDGRPFAAGASAGWGVENMRRRAQRLGGHLEICAFDAGTRVTITLPSRLPDLNG
jgi:two-component system sensor histidine kinase UhpB